MLKKQKIDTEKAAVELEEKEMKRRKKELEQK
jgi:hypothetical protein